MRVRKNLIVVLLALAPAILVSQIPSGYVQTTATVTILAGGTFGAAWTNLSSSSQLGLLGCVSTFQNTVNGSIDSYGHFSTLLADTAQICPTPSTWTFTLSCPAAAPGAFQIRVAVTGGGGTEDISSQITAALPAHICTVGGGGGGNPGGSNTEVQVNSLGAFAGYPTLTYSPSSGLDIGGAITGNSVIAGPQSTVPATWIFDWTTPSTALSSIGGVGDDGTGATGTWSISITGNASTSSTAIFATTANVATTANALTTSPTTCAAGYAPTGILANGNATGCTAYEPSVASSACASYVSTASEGCAVTADGKWFEWVVGNPISGTAANNTTARSESCIWPVAFPHAVFETSVSTQEANVTLSSNGMFKSYGIASTTSMNVILQILGAFADDGTSMYPVCTAVGY